MCILLQRVVYYTGVVALILCAVLSILGAGRLFPNLDALVLMGPAVPTLVMPMTGGSPFLTNSHTPGNLFPANLIASLTTTSCKSAPLTSNTTLLTAHLQHQ